MEYYHEVMLYIVENEPLASTAAFAEHFGWADSTARRWIEALRNWGWVVPKGRVRSTEKGREAVQSYLGQ